jgi:hypothetical protein
MLFLIYPYLRKSLLIVGILNERLLRVLQYVRRADYSDKIKYSSLIKVLFGRAAHYMTLSQKNQDIILNLFNKIRDV